MAPGQFREDFAFMTRLLPTLFAALVLAAAALLPPTAQADPIIPGTEHCVVNIPTSDSLNMRERPDAASRILMPLPYARCGIVVNGDCRGSWCPVEAHRTRGWAHRNYLAAVSAARYCVTGLESWDRLNLRAFPSASSRVIAQLPRGQCGIALLPYAVDNWQKVRLDGWEGWVSRRYLTARLPAGG